MQSTLLRAHHGSQIAKRHKEDGLGVDAIDIDININSYINIDINS